MDFRKGRLARRPFALGVTAVYVAGIAAQALLSGEIMACAGLWPFLVVQAAVIAIWLVLHVRRLRDAGQGPAAAIGVALVYVLSLALLLMLVAFFTNPNAVAPSNAQSVPEEGLAGMPAVFLLAVLFKQCMEFRKQNVGRSLIIFAEYPEDRLELLPSRLGDSCRECLFANPR